MFASTVRLMRSTIQVDSRLAQGSRFWFDLELPLAHGDVPTPRDSAAHTVAGYRGRRRTVLVVDDVAGNRATMVDLLAPLGFQVVEAENGEAGLQMARRLRPDLILMDNVMPVMDGLETTRRLRQLPELREVPVIAVSASASLEDQRDSHAVGAKPTCREKL